VATRGGWSAHTRGAGLNWPHPAGLPPVRSASAPLRGVRSAGYCSGPRGRPLGRAHPAHAVPTAEPTIRQPQPVGEAAHEPVWAHPAGVATRCAGVAMRRCGHTLRGAPHGPLGRSERWPLAGTRPVGDPPTAGRQPRSDMARLSGAGVATPCGEPVWPHPAGTRQRPTPPSAGSRRTGCRPEASVPGGLFDFRRRFGHTTQARACRHRAESTGRLTTVPSDSNSISVRRGPHTG